MKLFPNFRANGMKLDDWLSPILIKELRQGMRARVFVISFLLLQVFLILLVMGNVAAADDRYALDGQNHYFWLLVAFILLLLMPLRGLTAISNEVRHHTIETIILTRMTAWRVVFGKWSALFAQSLLFTSAVLPYIAIRYFVGGEEIISDFIQLFILLWLSAILIAVSIAISSSGNAVVRILLLIGLVIILISLAAGMAQGAFFGGQVIPLDDFLKASGWLALFGFFIPALLFEISATTIASTSENHAIRRRVLALAFYVLGLMLTWNDTERNPAEVIPMLALIAICYFEVAEKPRLLTRQVRPMLRFGRLGGIVGIFFLPGWPSALLFMLATVPIAMRTTMGIISHGSYGASSEEIMIPLTIYAVLGSVLVPMLICHLLWARMKQVLLMIFLYNLVMGIICWLLESFSALTNTMLYEILAFIPSLPALTDYTSWNRQNSDLYILGNSLTLGALLIICIAACRPYFRDLFALVRSGEVLSPTPENKQPKTPATP